ncbi:hypothetical protein PoB_005467900 [Plakobranchus ocellatus]|uniref:Uncharacterized protein n=1 Tax=Plakobranchus ocellatus TaxID=259542 RepID=A0AAV4C6J1_9GAST|nr:hypothetical protein PoB_005467900 [Plakobranchus ocellatus]
MGYLQNLRVRGVSTDFASVRVGVGGSLACESALRSAGTLLSRVRAPPSAPRPGGGPKSLRSPCCGLATYKNPTQLSVRLLINGRHDLPRIGYCGLTKV